MDKPIEPRHATATYLSAPSSCLRDTGPNPNRFPVGTRRCVAKPQRPPSLKFYHSATPRNPPLVASVDSILDGQTPFLLQIFTSSDRPLFRPLRLPRCSFYTDLYSTVVGVSLPDGLFTGNICRSPAAEAVFTDLVWKRGAESKFKIDSAGTIGYHEIKLMCSYCKKHSEAEVPDPYYGGPQGFEKVLDLLEDACGSLLDSIMAENSQTSNQ
ncbi:hypothetical protein GW17_00035467 [Ensete ventricosum]|nr:hypothetical protein GW17_00035467 [Ensete ventricosum]